MRRRQIMAARQRLLEILHQQVSRIHQLQMQQLLTDESGSLQGSMLEDQLTSISLPRILSEGEGGG